jgi:PAS domain S-box-containing protein
MRSEKDAMKVTSLASPEPGALRPAVRSDRLRQHAEELRGADPATPAEAMTLEEARRTLHQLQVAHIELELQNEELRGAQQELEETTARYVDLFELAPVGYLTLSDRGVILEANQAAAAMLGSNKGAMVNQPMTRFISPEDQDIFYRHRRKVFETGPQECEMRTALGAGGQTRWIHLLYAPVRNGGFRVTLTDSTELRRHRDQLGTLVLERTEELENRNARLEVEIAERKRAEEALSQSEQRYRAIVEDQTELIARFRPDGSYTFVNQAFCRFFGKSEDQVLVGGWQPPVLADDLPTVRKRLQYLSAANPVVVIETRVVSAAGDVRWMQFVNHGVFDAQGRLLETQAVGRDVTERKHAEEMLLVYADEVQDLYNNAPCGYHSLDDKGVYVRINDTELEWLGYQRHEIVGVKRFSDLVSPEGAQRFRTNFQRFMVQGSLHDMEYEMVRKDGSRFPVIVNAEVIRDAEGRYLMSRGTVFDNSERMLAEEERRRSEEKFRGIFENAPFGIFQTALDGRIISVNPTQARMFGFGSPQQMLAEVSEGSRRFFVHPEQRDTIVDRALDEGSYTQSEVQYRRRDDSLFTANLYMRAVHAESGDFLEGFVEDVTSRKQAEEALKKYARRLIVLEEDLRKRIAMELHDDIGQVLTALGLNLAHIGNRLQQQAGDGLKSIFEDSRMLTKEISRSVRNLMVELRPTQLEEYGLAAAIRSHAEQYAARTGIDIAVEADPDFPRLTAKKEIALFRISQEALNNASKHAAASRITVSLGSQGGLLRLAISDDGGGFVPQDASPQPTGSGWGLTIMRERAELIGGSFRVSSVPGAGTTVSVDFRRRG